MESKENKCNLEEEKRYSLEDKIAIITKMGIDYLGNYPGIPLEHQKKSIDEIIKKIVENPKLLEILDSIEDKFFDEALEKGIIMYSEMTELHGDVKENLLGKKQYCQNENFITAGGKVINIEEGEEIPVLAYQKKKIIELNRIY